MDTFGKFYGHIRNALLQWGRRWFGRPGEVCMLYLFLLPDLVRLLVNLLADLRVELPDKIFVIGVLLYVISPFELLPEVLIGPFGLIDDVIFLLVILYRLMSNPSNQDVIEELWQGDPAMLQKIRRGLQYIRTLILP